MNVYTPGIGLEMLVKTLTKRLEIQLDVMRLLESPDEISRCATVTFFISGLIALLIDWVMTDMPEPVETMDVL